MRDGFGGGTICRRCADLNVYSLVRVLLDCVLLDIVETSHGDQAKLRAEVLAVRRQV